MLADHLARRGAGITASELHRAVWTSIEAAPETIALAAELRTAGVGVHLATNQERHRAALEVLGATPAEVLLVDDSPANVRAARAHGLAAEQWHLDEGIDVLRRRLVAHGLPTAR